MRPQSVSEPQWADMKGVAVRRIDDRRQIKEHNIRPRAIDDRSPKPHRQSRRVRVWVAGQRRLRATRIDQPRVEQRVGFQNATPRQHSSEPRGASRGFLIGSRPAASALPLSSLVNRHSDVVDVGFRAEVRHRHANQIANGIHETPAATLHGHAEQFVHMAVLVGASVIRDDSIRQIASITMGVKRQRL